MRKALTIIGVVAGYSLFESGLLMSLPTSSIVSGQGYSYPATYLTIVSWGQFLLIPGLAALFSRIMYGEYGWPRRTLTILLAGSFGVPIAMIALFLPIILLAWAFDRPQLPFALFLPVILGVAVLGLVVGIRRSGRWGVRAEAARWLTERRSGVSARDRKWRIRGIRLASCIPSAMVLLVFLFLPETWGVLSHLSQPRSGNLPGYRVPIPTSWIVLYRGNRSGEGGMLVWGLAGWGIGRGIAPYFRGDLPFSLWDIVTEPYDQNVPSTDRWTPKDDEVISRRVFTIGSSQLACLDYKPSYLHYRDFSEASAAYVMCSDGKRLRASFSGKRRQVAAFYAMMAGITPTK